MKGWCDMAYKNKKRKKNYNINEDDSIMMNESIASATESTGTVPTPPSNDAEADSYSDISPVITKRSKRK